MELVLALLLIFSHSISNVESPLDDGGKSLRYFGEPMLNTPQGLAQFLVALDFSLSKPKQIIIAGKMGDPHTKQLLEEVQSRFIPNKIILLADGADGQKVLASYVPFLETVRMIDGKSTAYICENYACKLPTSEARVVAQLLDGKNPRAK